MKGDAKRERLREGWGRRVGGGREETGPGIREEGRKNHAEESQGLSSLYICASLIFLNKFEKKPKYMVTYLCKKLIFITYIWVER